MCPDPQLRHKKGHHLMCTLGGTRLHKIELHRRCTLVMYALCRSHSVLSLPPLSLSLALSFIRKEGGTECFLGRMEWNSMPWWRIRGCLPWIFQEFFRRTEKTYFFLVP